MLSKNELRDIITGNAKPGQGEIIQTIALHLGRKKGTISAFENSKPCTKAEEETHLIDFIDTIAFWHFGLDAGKHIGEGAEQKVFEHAESDYVIKTNDSIFYPYWEDYLHSLLIHNYFFPHLAYDLMGFLIMGKKLFSVVKQAYVSTREITDLNHVKSFLMANGFVHRKRNDYYHPELGIILEDLHDENVLTKEGALYFIDTVFYITPDFYQ